MNFIHFVGHTIEMDGDQSLGFYPLSHSVFYGMFQKVWIDVPSIFFTVYKNGGGSQISYGIGRGRESETLAQYFVSCSHSHKLQAQVDGCRARTQASGMDIVPHKAFDGSFKA